MSVLPPHLHCSTADSIHKIKSVKKYLVGNSNVYCHETCSVASTALIVDARWHAVVLDKQKHYSQRYIRDQSIYSYYFEETRTGTGQVLVENKRRNSVQMRLQSCSSCAVQPSVTMLGTLRQNDGRTYLHNFAEGMSIQRPIGYNLRTVGLELS